ncbi:MAG: UDP-N-acetylmuramate--L-alanine ligase [Thermoleophilia bacterium]|nr:UDP-N-acetylmuramate--L-alanine ligase [Thermoleophilia bacterium]
MSALARLAVAAGYRVSGTDRDDSATLAALRALGVDAMAGHRAAAIPADCATLVVSTAIAAGNPELAEAARRGIPVVHRADLLAELMSGHRGLAVAGAHGKSTTSAMLRLALGGASACIGATVEGGGGTGAVWGEGPWFVAEADESDRSLLRLRPEGAILLNVDHDHHSTYASLEEVEETFAAFLAQVPERGVVVAGPEPRAQALARASGRPVRIVGDAPDAWCTVGRAPDGAGLLRLADGREVVLRLAVPGAHNVANAACAVALADWCGVDPHAAAGNLAAFTGVGRRFEPRGTAAGVTVIDDYAHHPAEVAATLAAARERYHGRVIAVFQPHLYSRTRALWAELGDALGAADIALVTEIYAAREPHDPGISGRTVADAVPPPAVARFTPALADARDAVLELARPGDLVLTLGAGDVTTLGQELVAALQNQYGNGDSPGGAEPPA